MTLPTNGVRDRSGPSPLRETARATAGAPAGPDRDTRRELAKLTATYLNGIATALVAVGIVAPMIASLYGSTLEVHSFWQIAVTSVACLLLSFAFHALARHLLRKGFAQ